MNATLKTKLATLAAFAFVATASAFCNAETGRWLNRDPIGETGGPNIYVFALNDGIDRIDPLGQRSAIGAGKLCVDKDCQRQYLPNIQYIPEDPPYVLHRMPDPGQCVDIDAVYFPGEASYSVTSQNLGEAPRLIETSHELDKLRVWGSNSTVLICLNYSKPKRPKGNFEACEVWIQSGVVKERRSFSYWD